MKILMITGCVFAENCSRKHFTGLDYIVGDIATKLGETNQVDVFTITPYKKGATLKNVRIQSYRYIDLIQNVLDKNKVYYTEILKLKKVSIKEKLKNLRTILIEPYLSKLIEKEKYDIVHIHGSTFSNIMLAKAAADNNVPVLYTLHGVLSNGVSDVSDYTAECEKRLFRFLGRNKHKIGVISTGVKNYIEKISEEQETNISVIYNAVNLPKGNIQYDVRKQYGIEKDKKIILCVGTIGTHKNQIQLVRAFDLLDAEIKEKYCVLLLGQDISNGVVENYIYDHKLETYVKICGFIPKNELVNYYQIADFNIVLSKSEGFGLSIVEAAYYGVPTMCFSDLDLIEDIYSEKTMKLIKSRDDYCVAEAIKEMDKCVWDREYIKESVKKFNSLQYCEYEKLYEEIIEESTNYIRKEDVEEIVGFIK